MIRVMKNKLLCLRDVHSACDHAQTGNQHCI